MTTSEGTRFIADRGDDGQRLDLVIRRHVRDVTAASRTRVQAWIVAGRVTINGATIQRTAARVAVGDVIELVVERADRRRTLTAETAPLAVLYEDDHLLVINKPPGVVVHPSYKHAGGTIMNALIGYAQSWRPSLVHRLDKDTSGALLVAKSKAVHAALQRTMASKASGKVYVAVVYGRVNRARGIIDLPLGRDDHDRRRVAVRSTDGRASVTHFERLARAAAPPVGLTLMACRLGTGRMHQIRVHLAACGWPIVGDRVYGEPRGDLIEDARLRAVVSAFSRQALHAWRLTFTHPINGRPLSLEAPLPDDVKQLVDAAGLSAGYPAPTFEAE